MTQITKAGETMLDRYSESYQDIASRLVSELPSGWSEACILAGMRDDNGMVVGFARTNSSVEPLWLDLPASIYDAFRAMHNAAYDPGDRRQLWTSATMRLKNDGTLDVCYGSRMTALLTSATAQE